MEAVMNWDDYPNFTEKEFNCKETGLNDMKPEFMQKLQALRVAFDQPMTITSGYRSKTHSAEIRKEKAGSHTKGRACDIAVSRGDALKLVKLALMYGFTGLGVKQHGAGRFIHIDDLTNDDGFNRPMMWSYK